MSLVKFKNQKYLANVESNKMLNDDVKVRYWTKSSYIWSIVIIACVSIATFGFIYYSVQVQKKAEHDQVRLAGYQFISSIHSNYDRHILPIQTMTSTVALFYSTTPEMIEMSFAELAAFLFSGSKATNIFLIQKGIVKISIGEQVVSDGENLLPSYNYTDLPKELTTATFLQGTKKSNQTQDGIIILFPMIPYNKTVWGHLGAWLPQTELISTNTSDTAFANIQDYHFEIVENNGELLSTVIYSSSPTDFNRNRHDVVTIQSRIAQTNWIVNIIPKNGWSSHVQTIWPCALVGFVICATSVCMFVLIHRSVRLKHQSIDQVNQIQVLGNQVEQEKHKISDLSSREQILNDENKKLQKQIQNIHMRWDYGHGESTRNSYLDEDTSCNNIPNQTMLLQDHHNQNWTLDNVMTDSVCLEVFKDYARTNYAMENIMFLIHVNYYRQLFSRQDEHGKNHIHILAKYIFRNFVIDNSGYQINISCNHKHDLCKRINLETFPCDLFDKCEQEIKRLIHDNLLPQFLSSERFRMFVQKHTFLA